MNGRGNHVQKMLCVKCQDELLPEGLQGRKVRVLWSLASLAYGVIIGSVAIEFPMGSAVGALWRQTRFVSSVL